MITILTTLLVVDMYNCKFLWGFRATKVGGVVRYFFKSSKASCASRVHWNLSYFLRILKKGSPLTPSRKMNLLKVAIHPINFWTSWRLLGDFILVIADTFSRLGSCRDERPYTQVVFLRAHQICTSQGSISF
jgi:hypothetical protein